MQPINALIHAKTVICDGKTCGTGKQYCKYSSLYICSHNNLEFIHPNIISTWSLFFNNKLPLDYLHNSGLRAWWSCDNINCKCRIWESKIDNRVNLGDKGCPCCNGRLCPHNVFSVTHPHLLKIWDYETNDKNKIYPDEYLPGSNIKVSWICPDGCECHVYEMTIRHKTIGQGCPFCNHGTPCKHHNAQIANPEVCQEWDPDNNKSPTEFAVGSNAKVLWICRENSDHKWQATIGDRLGKLSKCPRCALTIHRSPETKGRDDNNLLLNNPELAKEFHPIKNTSGPEKYTPKSRAKIWWICNKGHEWEARISNRNALSSGCPVCINCGYSKMQIKWLQYLVSLYNINIIHAENGGEFKIKGIGKVDGYCKENNTVYEFHGDFFHGNPVRFHPDDINPIVHKSYGYLYNKTLERDEKIRLNGYNLITMWESQYKILKQEL